jgi:hypothetical protein
MFKHTNKTRGAVTATALAVGVLAVAGTTWASTPDGNGVIHSCYNVSGNSSGSLRVIDTANGSTCSKHEQALNFNQTGPQGPQGLQGTQGLQGLQGDQGLPGADGQPGTQGPQGEQGVQGIQGVQGAAGPSHAYIARNDGPAGVSPGGSILVSVNLPAGFYTLSGQAGLASNSGGEEYGVCTLSTGARMRVVVPYTYGTRWFTPVAVQDVLSLSSPGGASLSCSITQNASTERWAENVKLIAVRVGGITG